MFRSAYRLVIVIGSAGCSATSVSDEELAPGCSELVEHATRCFPTRTDLAEALRSQFKTNGKSKEQRAELTRLCADHNSQNSGDCRK